MSFSVVWACGMMRGFCGHVRGLGVFVVVCWGFGFGGLAWWGAL